MTDLDILTCLRAAAASIASLHSGVRWYVFGSVTRHNTLSADFDVFALCLDNAGAITVRKELCALANEYPLHLTIMTQREEEELQFISKHNCKELFVE